MNNLETELINRLKELEKSVAKGDSKETINKANDMLASISKVNATDEQTKKLLLHINKNLEKILEYTRKTI